MHFLMTALGSYGDVYPIVGLGAALRSRGHEVSIVTNPHFQKVLESVGIEFVPIGSEEDYNTLVRHEDAWHPRRGPLLVLSNAMVDWLRELYGIIDSQVRTDETVLVAHILDLASRVHHDKYRTPMASIHLAPVGFRSLFTSPQVYGLWMSSKAPVWLRRLQFWIADKIIDSFITPELNKLRNDLGLEPVSGIFGEWYFSPQRVLGLFPGWFAAPQPDWLPQIRLTGFPLWDQALTNPLPPEVDEFLSGGEPPLICAPGSANAQAETFFQEAVEVCKHLGMRGILLTKYPDQLPTNLPDSVRHFSFVPFSQLLPRSAAIIHHGGIGTSAQALAAGLPQLIMPMAYDQFDNAARLERLEVATSVRPQAFRAQTVARKLAKLLADKKTHGQCHYWAGKCNGEEALTTACEMLEAMKDHSVLQMPS